MNQKDFETDPDGYIDQCIQEAYKDLRKVAEGPLFETNMLQRMVNVQVNVNRAVFALNRDRIPVS